MTSISPASSTELEHGVSARLSTESSGTTEHPVRLLHGSDVTDERRSAAAGPTVSLVIPVRNEARNIGWVLEQIVRRGDRNHSRRR